jgi:hypothetical protein
MPHAKTLVQQVALNQEEVVCDLIIECREKLNLASFF